MIQIATLMATHPDNDFIVEYDNIRILTGMSNKAWESDMIEKAPTFLKDKIFHHGKLLKSNLRGLKNGLIIIDEIDCGDKQGQKFDKTLKDAGILNIEHMIRNNNRFVVISATMIKQYYDLYRWGPDLFFDCKMTIPDSYVGHKDFLEKGIIKEFYPLEDIPSVLKWIDEDILTYGRDFRVHIVRANDKTMGNIINGCISKGVKYALHMTDDRLSDEEIKEFFEKPLKSHIVLIIKRLFSRANLIPNIWKKRIGATHELCTIKVDDSVQIQGLPGRMTGYWKHIIESGHKIGPYRTSIKSIKNYEANYNDPFGYEEIRCSGFVKSDGKIHSSEIHLFTPENVDHPNPLDLPEIPSSKCSKPVKIFKLNEDEYNILNGSIGNNEKLKNYMRMKDNSFYRQYQHYNIQFWKLDMPSKYIKWGVNRMRKPGAYSTETNIREKTKNILMCYLYDLEKELIINPWNGENNLNLNISS